MKFEFVIGTPPYEDNTTKSGEKRFMHPVYYLFMDAAFNVATKVLFIIPARFLFNAGSTPKQWNQKMLNDPHFKVLKYVKNSTLVFPETNIAGGVVISYRNLDKIYEPIKIFVTHSQLLSLIDKVKKTNFRPLSDFVFATSSLKFKEKMYIEHPEIEERRIIVKGNTDNLTTNIFDKLKNIVFFKEKPVDNDEYVQIYGRLNNVRTYMWINKKYIQGSKNFDKYKIMLPASYGYGGIDGSLSAPIIGKPLIGPPMVGHTQTFLTIGCFESEDEALNCLKFIKTKFARMMLAVLKITQHNNKETWEYVPQQNFCNNSDIDWTKPVNEIDVQLYQKYNLTREEIEFIDSKIRSMND